MKKYYKIENFPWNVLKRPNQVIGLFNGKMKCFMKETLNSVALIGNIFDARV